MKSLFFTKMFVVALTYFAATILFVKQASSEDGLTPQNSGTTLPLRGISFVSLTTGGNPPTEDPIAYYPFNGDANDESGNGNDGTVFGATFTQDRFGNGESAINFGASTDDRVSLPYTVVDGLGDFSFSAFLVVDVLNNSNNLVTGARADEQNAFIINYNGVTPLGWSVWIDGDRYTFDLNTAMNDNSWHHLVIIREGDVARLYLDGMQVGSDISVPSVAVDIDFGGLFLGNEQDCVGGCFDPENGWAGSADDFRVYDRVLTQQEILDLYNEPPPDPFAQYNICYATTGSADPSNQGMLLTIDPITGAATAIGPTGIVGDDGPAVRAFAISSEGEMFAMSHTASSDIYQVNASTGASTFRGNVGLLYPGAISFDANDVLYAVDETNILYTLEPPGVRTVVGPTGVFLAGLAYDPTDGTMYGSGNDDDIYTVDLGTGLATLVGTTGLGGRIPDIHFDQDGNLFGSKRGTGNEYDYISIDKTTGAGTIVGSTGFWAVTGLATRLDPPPAIPCADISQFQSRCQPGGTIQARVTLASGAYEGEVVEFTIDDTLTYSVTVNSNQRASLSIGVFDPGNHTVALTDPPGCFDPITVRCRQSGIAMEGDFWNDEKSWEIPATTSLSDNYPNPFNPSTTIRYGLSEEAYVTVRVYNMLGQLVNTLADDFQAAGYQEVLWDGRNESGATVSSGIYIYRMTAGNYVQTKKMLLMK